MRPWLLMFLLLLSILIHDAQGIRLRKGSVPADRQHSVHEQFPGKRSNEGVGDQAILCKSKQCSGRVRKLTMIPISSSTTTIAKNDKNEEIKAQPKLEGSSTNQKIGRKEENLSVNSWSSKTQHGQPTPEPYPDVIDISEMDYSMAPRRKPPIHN